MITKENCIVYLGKENFSERSDKVAEIWNCDNNFEEKDWEDGYDVVFWLEELSYYRGDNEKKVLERNILDYDYLENMGILLRNGYDYIISYEEFLRLNE